MRLHQKLVAGALAAFLALGIAACEADPEALEELDEDPALEGEDEDL